MAFKTLITICIYISIINISLLAQVEERRHWKYIDDFSTIDPTSDLAKLKTVSWTGACYIGQNKAVIYASGDLLLFDYDSYLGEWRKLEISDYYVMNSQGVRELATNGETVPTNLNGTLLAYLGGNKILLGPGRLGSGNSVSFARSWVFDLDDNTWTLMLDETGYATKTIPSIYDYGMCHLTDDKVLVFGGRTSKANSNGTNNTYIYDLSNNEWTSITSSSTPEARTAHAVASLGDGSALMFGGSNDTGNLNDTWVLNYEGNTPEWTLLNTPAAPSARYYHLLQKFSTDIAILYGGTTSYNTGEEHYNDVWRFDFDRENTIGTWSDISFSDTPSRTNHASSKKDDYLYYPSSSTDPLANENYRHIDGESTNNGGGGYDSDINNNQDAGVDGSNLPYDHWGRQHGKRRATAHAFLGNDRILLHGGGLYSYDGTSETYGGSSTSAKTYIFDLGIPDIFIEAVKNNPVTGAVDVTLTIGKLNDDRGEALSNSDITVYLKYKRSADDTYVIIPVDVLLNESSSITINVELNNLPPNVEIEIIGEIKVDNFGNNQSDSYSITTPGGEKTIHLINSNTDGVTGEDDYIIQNSETLDLSAGFSICQWVKLEKELSQYSIGQSSRNPILNLTVSKEQILFTLRGTDGSYTSQSVAGLDLEDDWHYIVITYDANLAKQYIYLDGILLVEDATTSNVDNSLTYNLAIDIKHSVSIEEFQLWKQTLTQSQMLEIMYQPVDWGFPNEVQGAVTEKVIDNIEWDDLAIYYKGNYLDQATPFSATKQGCICKISGRNGMCMVNNVESARMDTGYYTQSDIPYINWVIDASHASLTDDFSNEDNWYAGMNPTSESMKRFQTMIINQNTNSNYPIYEVQDYIEIHTLVLKNGTKIELDPSRYLYISKKLVNYGSTEVLLENGSKMLIGGENGTTLEYN